MKFTGEYYVPGETPERIEADHLARYRFASRSAAGKEVLDIACGVGYGAEMVMAGQATSYRGVDIKEELIEFASGKYGGQNIAYECGDITTYSSGSQFDLVLCFETIEHVSDYVGAIRNLARLVKVGGTLLISSPNRPSTSPRARRLEDQPANKFHTQEFTPTELMRVLAAEGFVVNPSDIFGQRLSVLPTRLARIGGMAAKLLGRRRIAGTSEVLPFRWASPRYFVLRATRTIQKDRGSVATRGVTNSAS